jgi:superfamily II DNA or RNA helicase/HKD family nuclease
VKREDSGIYEEIFLKNKSYPANQHTFNIHPAKHTTFLIQQVMRDLSETFRYYEETNQFQEILGLTNQVRRLLLTNHNHEMDMPLKAIHYRNDEMEIPLYPEFFLSNPLLITNSGTDNIHLFKTLKYELLTADNAYFMVSFVRWSGLQLLLRVIDDFRVSHPNRKIKILTSTYLKITEPKALRRLLEFPHIETKVFDSGHVSFHTKAYLFERTSNLHTVIIGSSNLTYSALQTGHEWNVKLPGTMFNSIYDSAYKAFVKYWSDSRALPLTNMLVDDYEEEYNDKKVMLVNPFVAAQHVDFSEDKNSAQESDVQIVPNKMQREALQALQETRRSRRDKAVVIAATGTGKTYLSAFDVKDFGAKTMLFLAHRDEILENSIKTFQQIFGNKNLFGKLTGTSKEGHKPYLFSTVQTLSRDEILSGYQPNHFDYIIVDEFHHAEASTYKKVLDHFKTNFLLGLTATPERMDGRDVLALCDHNVVYEIRLRDALEEGLLAPFRYFGLGDPTVNYENIGTQSNGLFIETELVRELNTHERVDYVIQMIRKFGYDGEHMKALGFCASIEHARYMCDEFNQRGFGAAYLTGNDSPDLRQQIIRKLEEDTDPLQIILTVNVFNEGVDIPKVNLVLFLRPTESATVFIQQLGRGLRKVQGKEYVTILDFIGNYQKSFIVPLALSGQHNHKAFDRDSLRVAIETEFADLPDGCFVDLEEISRKQILAKIETIRMDRDLMLMDLYNQFRKELGRSPEVEDFLYVDGAPSLHFFVSKYGSWVKTKKKMNDLNDFDNLILGDELLLQIIERLEKMLPIKWPYELSILGLAVEKNWVRLEEIIADLEFRFATHIPKEQQTNKIYKAMTKLSEVQFRQNWSFGKVEQGMFQLAPAIREKIVGVPSAKQYINERIEYGLGEFRRVYHPSIFFQSEKNVILYQNYTRNDLIYLFESKAKTGSWREGVSRVDNHYLLFINLKKGEKVSEHLMYHDYFIDQQHFHWQSQNTTTHASMVGQNYVHHQERDIHIHLFVRKFKEMHGVVLPFTYLGEIDYVSSHGDKPMNITWKLQKPIPEALYTDFIR